MRFPLKILNKKKFVLCFINAFMTNLFFYITPALLAYFTSEPFTLEKLKYLILSIVVTKILAVSLNHIWILYVLKFENEYAKDLQLAYFRRIVKMKPNGLSQVHNGFLKRQIDVIAQEGEELLEQIFETVSGCTISIVMFLTQVIHQDVQMFWICLAMIASMVLYNLWLGKKYVAVQEKFNDSYAKYNSSYVDFLQNMKTVKRLNASQFAEKKNEALFQKALPSLNKMNLCFSFRSNGISAFTNIMYVAVLINLYFKMQDGANILSSLLFYGSIFNLLTGELKSLTFLFVHFNKFQAASNQVEKIVGPDEPNNIIEDWKKIEIHDLKFQYKKDAELTISIPHFEMKRGDKISIIGKSGQGKTTFLGILARDMEITEESYQIDGKSVNGNLDLAYISQEIDLFDLTVRENLCLGQKIEDEKLLEYLKEAGLEEWVNQLENGLDTVVGERGLKLSVGQKQRLNLIRGILLDKELYFLDEPTSNLDKETEKLMVHFMEKYLKDKTVVIVTHREEIRKICNKHYEFEGNQMKLVVSETRALQIT